MYILIKCCLTDSQKKKKLLTHGTYPHCTCVGHNHFFSELLKYPPNLSSFFLLLCLLHAYFQHISQSNLSNFRQIILFLSSYSCHVLHFTHSKRQTIQNDLFCPLPSNRLSLRVIFLIIFHSVSTTVAFLHFSLTLPACSDFRDSCRSYLNVLLKYQLFT